VGELSISDSRFCSDIPRVIGSLLTSREDMAMENNMAEDMDS
jgi:hypothetical protein